MNPSALGADYLIPPGPQVPISVSSPRSDQSNPAIAATESLFLLSWAETAPAGVFAARVNAGGVVLDRLPIRLDDQGGAPATAAARGTFLVTWQNRSDIKAALVAESGEVLKILIVAQASPGSILRVASSGDNFLVVWRDGGYNIHGGRVGVDGVLLDRDPFLIERGIEMAVGFDGRDFWVASAPGNSTVVARRVSPGGSAEAASRGLSFLFMGLQARDLTMGCGGDGCLVLWRSGKYIEGLGGTLFSFGTVKHVVIARPGGNLDDVAIAFAGSYVVAWGAQDAEQSDFDIHGSLVATTEGRISTTVEHPAPLVASSSTNETSPAVAVLGRIVVFAFASQADGGLRRVFFRVGGLGELQRRRLVGRVP